MKDTRSGGYVVLLMLLVGVALTVFFILRTDMITGDKGSKSVLEQSKESVERAEALRFQLEQNSAKAILQE